MRRGCVDGRGPIRRDWFLGTKPGEWASMAVCSQGQYDVPEGLIFSFPCTTKDGNWTIVEGLEHNDYAKAAIKRTADELLAEKAAVADLLG